LSLKERLNEDLKSAMRKAATEPQEKIRVSAKKSNISQHLALLSAYKLVTSRKHGKNIYFNVAYPELAQACQLIDTILKDQLERDFKLFKGGI
jgi:uncharacterized protein YqeY